MHEDNDDTTHRTATDDEDNTKTMMKRPDTGDDNTKHEDNDRPTIRGEEAQYVEGNEDNKITTTMTISMMTMMTRRIMRMRVRMKIE